MQRYNKSNEQFIFKEFRGMLQVGSTVHFIILIFNFRSGYVRQRVSRNNYTAYRTDLFAM